MSWQLQQLVDEDKLDCVLNYPESDSERQICAAFPCGPFWVFRPDDAESSGPSDELIPLPLAPGDPGSVDM